MANLLALCRTNGELQIKRVSVTQTVQDKVEGLFKAQAAAFLDGVSEEVEFGGDWKPDADEILVMDAPAEAATLTVAVAGNPMALAVIDAAAFGGENIKALCVSVGDGGNQRILIQLFTAQQILARRFSLLLDGDTFKELTAPAFTLDNYIHAIIENGKLKFKSFFNVKRIFSLNQLYEEASDAQIDVFCAHESLSIPDVAGFKGQADQIIRKLVFACTKTNVLDSYPVTDIVSKANSLGLNITVQNDKIVMPADRKNIKTLLRFLDDGIYEASLTAKRYMTNSKRPLA
jgi:hypothetical protein